MTVTVVVSSTAGRRSTDVKSGPGLMASTTRLTDQDPQLAAVQTNYLSLQEATPMQRGRLARGRHGVSFGPGFGDEELGGITGGEVDSLADISEPASCAIVSNQNGNQMGERRAGGGRRAGRGAKTDIAISGFSEI